MTTEDEVYRTRLENVRRLMAQWGGPTSLSRKLGHKNGAQMSQCAGPNPTRAIGENFARSIEAKLELPRGWLDQQHEPSPSGAVRIDDELLMRASLAVTEAAGARRLTPQQHARITSLVYDHSSAKGTVDERYVKKLLSIIG